MRIFLLLLALVFSTFSFAQSTVQGRVLAGIDGSPLAYVNIGIIGKGIGTVSATDGSFTIKVGDRFDNDTIRVSMVGYKSKEYMVSDFKSKVKSDLNITLEEATQVIDEIAIVDSKMKTKIIGNRTTNRNFSLGFETDTLGKELAVKIKTRRKLTVVNELNLSINANNFGTVRFRVNFYESKRGKPGALINTRNIIVETDIENDILTVDLREYNISHKKNFFVSIEWIEDLGEGDLSFSAAFPAREVYYRSTSHDSWRSIKALGIGMNLKVMQ